MEASVEERQNGGRHTDNMYRVGILSARNTNEEIIRLNVSIDEGLVVNGLDTRYLQNIDQ